MPRSSFQVVVTPDRSRDEVGLFRTDGDIVKQGIAHVAAREARGSPEQLARRATVRPRRTSTRAFVNEVQAQAGKAIENAVAAILIADAQYLIAHCP